MFCVIARGTQNKPIIRHRCIPPRMANMGNVNSIQCWWSWSWTGICEHFVGIHVDQQLFGELWNTYSSSEMPVSFLHVYFRELKKKICIYQKDSCKNLYNSVAFYNSSVEMTRNACAQEAGWAVFDAVPQGTPPRNKRSCWNTMHMVPDSVTLSAATEPCTVADCGRRRVGGSGLGRYEGLFLPWFS